MFDGQAVGGQDNWPHVSLIEVMTAPDDAAKLQIVAPTINQVAILAARLMTIADDHEEAMRFTVPEQAMALHDEMVETAVRYTRYFTDNVTCLTLAEEFAPHEARAACVELTHGATVACKRVPNLLWQESICSVVAKGFDDFQRMPAAAVKDQDALIDSLVLGLTVTAPAETPKHLGTLAHAISNWGRKQPTHAEPSLDGTPRLPASARADAAARLILSRLGRNAEAELNPDGMAAA